MTNLLGRRFRLIADGNEGAYGYTIVGVDFKSINLETGGELTELLGEATSTGTLRWYDTDDVQLEPT